MYVDLCLPRNWLEPGVEHWNVVEVGGVYESMSQNYKPRLRWAMHRNHLHLRDRLRNGSKAWTGQLIAEDIPRELACDEAGFAGWLTGRDRPGTKHPPYFTGSSPGAGNMTRSVPCSGKATAARVVQQGDGGRHPAGRLAAAAGRQAGAQGRPARRADSQLAAYRPAIIWSDPDGRVDFPMPPPRRGGSLRRAEHELGTFHRRRDPAPRRSRQGGMEADPAAALMAAACGRTCTGLRRARRTGRRGQRGAAPAAPAAAYRRAGLGQVHAGGPDGSRTGTRQRAALAHHLQEHLDRGAVRIRRARPPARHPGAPGQTRAAAPRIRDARPARHRAGRRARSVRCSSTRSTRATSTCPATCST